MIRQNRLILSFLFLFAIFCPTLRGVIGTIGSSIVNGGLIVIGACIIYANRKICFVNSEERKVCILLLGAMAYYFIAISFGMLFLSQDLIVGDVFELHRPVLYIILMALPFVLVKDVSDMFFVETLMKRIYLIVLLIGLAQALHIPGSLSLIYTKELNVESGRITIPFISPYDYGMYSLLFTAYFLVSALMRRGNKYWLFLAVNIGAITFTQSRAIFIALVITLTFIVPGCLIYIYRGHLARLILPHAIQKYIAGMIMVIGVGFFAYLQLKDDLLLEYLIVGMGQILQGEEIYSVTERSRQLLFAWEHAERNPLVFLFAYIMHAPITMSPPLTIEEPIVPITPRSVGQKIANKKQEA